MTGETATKAKSGRSWASRRPAFQALLDHMAQLEPLALASSDRWQEIIDEVDRASRQVDLDRIEDEVDAILCARVAWTCWRDRDAMQVYGDRDAGFVVTPPPPRLSRHPWTPHPPGRPRDAP